MIERDYPLLRDDLARLTPDRLAPLICSVNVAQLGVTDFPQHFEAAVKFLPIVRIECKPSVSAEAVPFDRGRHRAGGKRSRRGPGRFSDALGRHPVTTAVIAPAGHTVDRPGRRGFQQGRDNLAGTPEFLPQNDSTRHR